MCRDQLADRTQQIDASGIRRVFALAAELDNPVNFSIGQPDFEYADFDPTVSRNTTRSPHQVAVDSENQLVYMVDAFSGRNAITMFDIHPDRFENQPDAVDVLGKLTDAVEQHFCLNSPYARV